MKNARNSEIGKAAVEVILGQLEKRDGVGFRQWCKDREPFPLHAEARNVKRLTEREYPGGRYSTFQCVYCLHFHIRRRAGGGN